MTRAIRVHEFGGPEVMRIDEIDTGTPGEGEARIRHTAIGLNMSDCNRRRGLQTLALPFVPGSEGAAVVEAVGPGVMNVAPGDRVGYGGALGSYCDQRLIDAWKLVRIPDDITDRQVAAMMLKGLTVHYLIHWSYAVQAGDTVLIHAAAGGIGLIFCQWAKHLGATVLGTVGTEEKAEIAAAHGCDHTILYTRDDFAEKALELTDGKGCDAVYDSVGKDTLEKSFACTARRGRVVSFGQASGPIAQIDTAWIRAGSKSLAFGGLPDFTTTADEIATGARRLFALVQSGAIRIEINQTFALADVADAHRALEGRRTTGSTVLMP